MNHQNMNQPLNILYICTHNRCRSALSEAITNQYADKYQNQSRQGSVQLIAKSAGSAPAGEVHPLTLQYLEQAGYKTDGLTSNSWDDSDYMGDFVPDVLITVCDNAAGEACPIWLGNLPHMIKLHWGLADPSKDTSNEEKTAQNFADTIAIIEQRVAKLAAIANLPVAERQQALKALLD